MEKESKIELIASSREYFDESVSAAIKDRKIDVSIQAKGYLVDLLNYYLAAEKLFELENDEYGERSLSLAEMLLKAQSSHGDQKMNLLKKLGDKSLYISGFFSDSLSRKIVDSSYYIQMGETAFKGLAAHSKEDLKAKTYNEISKKFVGFVDILTYISLKSQMKTNKNMLQIYDTYLKTGSELARQTLIESGIVTFPTQNLKVSRQ